MPLKPRLKPREAEPEHPAVDPWNVLLDEFEAQVRLLLDNGLAPQLRTRLDRLLPLGTAAATTVAKPSKADLDPMVLSVVLVTCRQMERLKLTADQHQAIGRLKAWLLVQLRSDENLTITERTAA